MALVGMISTFGSMAFVIIMGIGMLSIIWFSARVIFFFTQYWIRYGKKAAIEETTRRFLG